MQYRLDLNRRERLGMVEAVWGENKSYSQIAEILEAINSAGEVALVTRINEEKAKKILPLFPSLNYHPEAKCLTFGMPLIEESSKAKVAILSGGTSDLPVAYEAELALRCHGIKANTLLDVGVAGIHRLLNNLEEIKKAKVIIACAGMEGALPTVLAGLIPQPIIGVPISIGYGIAAGGKAALLGMLSSCSPGLVVVNIDNGYGAAMAALRIINGLIKE